MAEIERYSVEAIPLVPAAAAAADALDAENARQPELPETQNESWRILAALARFGLLVAGVWVLLYGIHRAFPGIRPGAELVYERKLRCIAEGDLFPSRATTRVVVCGDSRVLSGFIPDVFDHLSHGEVASYNLGVPASDAFIDDLERLVERGECPTHVLLTLPWSQDELPSSWNRWQHDDWLMDSCFPFRRLPRDAVLFCMLARKRGGTRAFYNQVLALVDQMARDRGYYFIESLSEFPARRLPDDFHLDSDRPHKVLMREAIPQGPVFNRLLQLARKGRFRVFLMPTYWRDGAVAIATQSTLGKRLAEYGIVVLGPDYWTFSNRFFSDPMHTNPEGARLYTTKLWELFAPFCETAAAQQRDPVARVRLNLISK
jgi:hypothetical protein